MSVPTATAAPAASAFTTTTADAAEQRSVFQAEYTAEEIASLKTEAAAGETDAQWKLGEAYNKGRGVPQSHAEAARYLAAATAQGHPEAQFLFSTLYSEQWTLEASHQYTEAKEILVHEALGDAQLLNELGCKFLASAKQSASILPSHSAISRRNAIRCFRTAAEKGNVWAALNMAELLLAGKDAEHGLPHSPEAAFQYLVQSASGGVARSQFLVGQFYYQGLGGVQKDRVKARMFFEQAAQQDHGEALLCLANCHRDGEGGLQKNHVKAFELYQRSAKAETLDAVNELGFCHRYGEGTPADPFAASAQWLLGARAFHVGCMREVALQYMRGEGVEKSLQEAIRWTSMAAEMGDQVAGENLNIMLQQQQAERAQ